MADSFTPYINLRKPEVTAATDTWGGPAGLNGDLDRLDSVFQPDGLSAIGPDGGPPGVGLRIGTGKVLNALEGTVKVTASQFGLYSAADPTKIAQFNVSNIPTATTRSYELPAPGGMLCVIDAPQVLTNKTAPDPPVNDNTQKLPSTKWVNAAINAAVAAAVAAYTAFNTGDIIASAAAAKTGWVKLSGGSIGTVGSPATLRANADCLNLFTLFWSIWGTGAGAYPVSGGRGANAAADFAAQKTITLPDARGLALVGMAGALGLTKLFEGGGSPTATFTLTVPQLPAHTHTVPDELNPGGDLSGGGSYISKDLSNNGVSGSTGTGADITVPVVQPSMATQYWIKL